MKLFVRPEAWSEMADATHWYEGQEKGLGVRFLDHLDEAFERIQENPFLYQEVDPEIRRARMRPFPYGVFYSIVESTIQVLGVVDDRRDPAVWRKRIKERQGEASPEI